MLSEFDYSELEKQANSLYATLESQIYVEIVERINAVGYANTVVENNANILQEMGVLYSNIVTTIAKETNSTYNKISQILYNAGVKSISYDDEIYISAGLSPIKINQSTSMVQLINATIANTSGNLKNLVNTTATTTQTSFYNAMNLAYLEVTTGVKSYSQAIIDAIDDLAEKGISIIYPSGYKTSLENAVRTNILTSTSQMCGKLQEMRAEELGWDLMELTAHEGARPSHAEWQGGIVSLSGKSGYLSKEAIGYGEVDGFKGINCRHDWFPYYEGSSRAYSEEQLEQYKNAKVTYNGKTMSLYDATQLQRSIERQIRVDKKKIAGREKLLTSITTDKTEKELKSSLNYYKAKLELDKNNLNDLLKQTSLTNQAYRTKISAKGEYNTKSVVNYAEKLYNSSSKTNNLQNFVDDEIIRKHIRNNYNLTLNEGAQDKHIIGTNNYNTEIANGNHPSIIYLNNEEIQDIINKYAGTGKIYRQSSSQLHREVIVLDSDIGELIDEETGESLGLTNSVTIHYSAKKGAHIVPTYRRD